LKLALILMLTLMVSAVNAAEPVTLVLDRPETAGISGFRQMWNTPVVLSAGGAAEMVDKQFFGKAPSAVWSAEKRNGGEQPGALVFDAVHRSMLVRFPDAAGKIR